MAAPQTLLDLVARFAINRDAYRAGGYNEAQTRIEFIDPMFKLLGWDVSNELGYAEAYKRVLSNSLSLGRLATNARGGMF